MTTEVDDARLRPAASGEAEPAQKRRRLPYGRGAALVVALAVIGALLVFRPGSEPAKQPAPPADQDLSELAGGPPEGYLTYRDDEAGFTLYHPASWLPIARPQQTLRLALNAGGLSSLLVRVQPMEQVIASADDLRNIGAVTDGIAASGANVEVLKRDPVNVNGMPGFFYLSRLTDKDTAKVGVNAHYFLFQGHKMNIILFQAVPEDQFTRLAPDFDKVLNSFRSDPEPPAPPPAGG